MDFLTCVKIVLAHEGGYSDDPNDSGGRTRYGISQRAYPDVDIKNLTEEHAIAIYKRDYWSAIRADELHEKIRLIVFDCAVNQGVSAAAKILQRSCGTGADGVIGDTTIALSKIFEPDFLIQLIAKQRLQAYAKHPRWDIYGAGWASRLLDVALKCQSDQT